MTHTYLLIAALPSSPPPTEHTWTHPIKNFTPTVQIQSGCAVTGHSHGKLGCGVRWGKVKWDKWCDHYFTQFDKVLVLRHLPHLRRQCITIIMIYWSRYLMTDDGKISQFLHPSVCLSVSNVGGLWSQCNKKRKWAYDKIGGCQSYPRS